MRRFLFTLLCVLSLCACASVGMKKDNLNPRSFSSTVTPKLPYERTLHWKDWLVRVRALPSDAGEMAWFEVRTSRVRDDIEEKLLRTTYDAEGILQQSWLVDLKGNGWPVLILFLSDEGKGRYGFLRLVECRETGFRALENPNTPRALLTGYRGGDVWRWEAGVLIREFPLYKAEDEMGSPTDGRRLLRYQWDKGKWRVRFQTQPANF
jgi:hypothetical protein